MESGQNLHNPEAQAGKKHKKTGRIIGIVAILIVFMLVAWVLRDSRSREKGKRIEIKNNPSEQEQGLFGSGIKKEYPLANQGNVSPISGLACDNWSKRPIAVMVPSDRRVRPLSGLSQAEMVVEMPVLPDGTPRLMAVYVCELPSEVGPIRSSRHDFISIAKGLDAIFAHWGGSQFAKEKLKSGVIDNLNGNNDGGKSANQCFFIREDLTNTVEDQKRANVERLAECAKEFDYRTDNEFSGYVHQGEAPMEDRIDGGVLKVGLDSSKGDYYVEYEYDKETNSYLRTWGGTPDTDRNNGKRIAPKNVVVLTASQEIMTDDNDTVYNNVQLGDPWYDSADRGQAFYYINGAEIEGRWEKDKGRVDSKLRFLDSSNNPIKFVPGQIWVEVLEPGRSLKWTVEEEI